MGKLREYTGVKSLNPFINKDKIIGELLEFEIPVGKYLELLEQLK